NMASRATTSRPLWRGIPGICPSVACRRKTRHVGVQALVGALAAATWYARPHHVVPPPRGTRPTRAHPKRRCAGERHPDVLCNLRTWQADPSTPRRARALRLLEPADPRAHEDARGDRRRQPWSRPEHAIERAVFVRTHGVRRGRVPRLHAAPESGDRRMEPRPPH